METTNENNSHSFRCPTCDGEKVVLAYSTPVFAVLNADSVTRVVVSDEEIEFAHQAWCRTCGDRWRVETEPGIDPWPAWEVGWR